MAGRRAVQIRQQMFSEVQSIQIRQQLFDSIKLSSGLIRFMIRRSASSAFVGTKYSAAEVADSIRPPAYRHAPHAPNSPPLDDGRLPLPHVHYAGRRRYLRVARLLPQGHSVLRSSEPAQERRLGRCCISTIGQPWHTLRLIRSRVGGCRTRRPEVAGGEGGGATGEGVGAATRLRCPMLET